MVENHPPETHNNYVFEISDGDNWGDDNRRALEFVNKMLPLVKAMGYGEITPDSNSGWMHDGDKLSAYFDRNVNRTRFVSIKFKSRDDVFDALKMFFNIDSSAKKQV